MAKGRYSEMMVVVVRNVVQTKLINSTSAKSKDENDLNETSLKYPSIIAYIVNGIVIGMDVVVHIEFRNIQMLNLVQPSQIDSV